MFYNNKSAYALSADETLEQRIVDEGICVIENKNLPEFLDGLYCKYNSEKIICLRAHMSASRRLCILAEEYGHAVTSWGNAHSMNPAEMMRQEARAIAYAIELVVPLETLYKARNAGVRNAYECAEHLGVTEEFLTWVFAYYDARVPGFRTMFMDDE